MCSLGKLIALSAILLTTQAAADSVTTAHGGDLFTTGSTISQTYDAGRDVFAAGEVIAISGRSAGDIHVAGMDVTVTTSTDTDLYAAGATVTIGADVAQDLSAMGYSVRLLPDSTVGGNARLLGRAIVIDGPIAGALIAAGGEVVLNSVVQGDVRIMTERMRFGPDARILGQLTYRARAKIDIPDRVIPADRVRFERWTRGPMWDDIHRTWQQMDMPLLPGFLTVFAAFVITLAFFVLTGSIFLTFAPQPVAQMRHDIAKRPGRLFLLGILGLSVLFGLVPITALTIIGIPFIPFAILLIIGAWTLGYVLAAYAVAMRVVGLAGGPADPSLLFRLLVLALAVCIVTLLNFIPFVGWIINYTLVLLGIGAMTAALFNHLIGNPGDALTVDMTST
ncbi:hypothetical protein [Yoonia sp.]|uniref:hypothetical protein n=1 Tax=Yoonia sp. TaxID=2212373 RepID=UPI0025E4CE4C|nr:hypothetical protein [Yoonia sp.]